MAASFAGWRGVSPSMVLLYSSDSSPQLVPRDLGIALRECVIPRTLQDHLKNIRLALPGSTDHDVLRIGREMIATGLLKTTAESLQVTSHPIEIVVVPTADRPSLLRRCLDSYTAHAERHGNNPRVLVVDGSKQPQHASINESVTQSSRGPGGRPIEYVGRAEQRAMVQFGASNGLDAEVLAWLLRGSESAYAAGAVRNAMLLLTAGHRVLTVDDDTIANIWQPETVFAGIRLVGHWDPRDTLFFESRDASLASVSSSDTDLLNTHAHYLGQPLRTLGAASTVCDVTGACPHLLGAISDSRRKAAIRAVWSGLAGDAGTYSPWPTLFATGTTRDLLAQSESQFILALRTREVQRSVSIATVTDDPLLMAYCMSISNDSFVPPFNPLGYNEDGLFGVMLRACEPDAFFCHIASGVVHAPKRPSEYEDVSGIAKHVRMADVIGAICESWRRGRPRADGDWQLRCFGRALSEFSRLSVRDFEHYLRAVVADLKVSLLDRCRHARATGYHYPGHWIAAFETLETEVCVSFEEPGWFVPLEYWRGDQSIESIALVQDHLRLFAEALTVWPDLRELFKERDGRFPTL